MTEDEAKTKWCPAVRVMNTTGEGGGNRWDSSGAPNQVPANPLCIGSACMAWRWLIEHDGTFNSTFNPTYADGGPDAHSAPNFRPSKTEGFCGLAGAAA